MLHERMVKWNFGSKYMSVKVGHWNFQVSIPTWGTSFFRIRRALMTKCLITLMAFSSPPSCKMYPDALQLYFDDLEPTNPLGSKLGAVHFNLKNLSPDCNSSISNMDMTRFWKSLMDGFRWLENSAVELKGQSHWILLNTCLLTADNLARLLLCGYLERVVRQIILSTACQP